MAQYNYLTGLVLVGSVLLLMPSQAARILCVSHQFKSHLLMVHSVAEGLIEKGHEVYTVFSDRMTLPEGLEDKGFKVLRYHTPPDSDIMTLEDNSKDIVEAMLTAGVEDSHMHFANVGRQECLDMDNDKKLTQQITALKIDMMIIDVFPLSFCLTFMSFKFDIPFIVVTASPELEITRSPLLPSFAPSVLSLFSDDMNFLERVSNTYYTLFFNFPMVNQYSARTDTSLLVKYCKDPQVTSWNQVVRKADLFFEIRGYILEYPLPVMPNVISVECLTCVPGNLPPDTIQVLIDNAESVIVVSFGSLLDDFPDRITDKFLEAFAERQELILWRFNGKFPGTVPANVKVLNWLPQNDLLAHPKTKLFITHSGNNGQYESIYHGVPMLAIPVFAEQPHNAARIVKHGYGLQLDFKSFTSKELSEKIREIIDNPSYRQKAQNAGRILKSRKMDAKQKAVYWIEHVLEFGGDHLRSHALDMPWYSFLMIDIFLFVEVCIMLCTIVTLCVLRFLTRRLCGTSTKEKQH